MELMEKVWTPAKLSAKKECEALEEMLATLPTEEHFSAIEPWDWRYLAEKVRTSKYSVDEAALKPYFPLSRMQEAVFDCATQLYGLRFVPRPDLPTYHADVQVFEVREMVEGVDCKVGLFLHDNYMRPFKRSGAWMSAFRTQGRNNHDGDIAVTPIIINNNNFAKSGDTLLSFDDVVTLFHEFGHGLHGLLSNVKYNKLSGTSVLKDFVELPSQLMEHWCSQPEVLRKYALHHKTGEPIPEALLNKLLQAKCFNQGFGSVEFTISALIDQSIHKLSRAEIAALDVNKFEEAEMLRLGMPREIVPRHRLVHFQHLFGGSMYAAGYYVYLWAEVLDADAFDAFTEAGSIFSPEVAARCRKFIYSSGNSLEPGEAFRLFRGREPVVQPMLKKKGLLVA
jgi:peptidyl-dipeptidase Dcp